MTLSALLAHWRSDPQVGPNLIEWRRLPRKIASFAPIPEGVHPALRRALESRGYRSLYTHQTSSYFAINDGENIVIVTGTASGKTLCYNLAVLDHFVKDKEATALYIFPTKALAQDQLTVLQALSSQIQANNESIEAVNSLKCAIYDGDTPVHARSTIRSQARLVLTNPDMLHTGILPHHTGWAQFFHGLRFVVIDEVHSYRGVFGSHVANVIRRLKRVAKFYGATPQFILTSATIGNPDDLGRRMIDEPVTLIDNDGAGKGEKHFLIYNPPILDKSLGLRKSAIQSGVSLADDLLSHNLQTIVFSRARRTVEIILTYLREQARGIKSPITGKEVDEEGIIRGYRSGYLPGQRRAIEEGLRKGDVRVVVATNALELGIDIGGMEASLLVGYPGTIAATWQQAGRAGRGDKPSLAVLIASPNPLDQYLAQHPDYFFSQSPEHGMINPDNLLILLGHLRCAAFELPFTSDEVFGSIRPSEMQELMDFLQGEGVLHRSGNKFFWMADKYPAQNVSLRSASTDTVLLQAPVGNTRDENASLTIGEVDTASSYWMVHPGAVYMHEGTTYLVKDLDLGQHIATLQPSSVDYYTEPRREDIVQQVEKKYETGVPGGSKAYGDVQVTSQVIGFRKIRWHTNETLGLESLDLPPTELLTTGYWLALADATVDKLKDEGLWSNAPNDYGPSWPKMRDLARARDGFRCQVCGLPEGDKAHHIHHKVPFRMFDTAEQANQLANLITVCNSCHRKIETAVRVRSGLAGLAFTLGNLAPLFLMCDIGDLGIHSDPQSSLAEGKPAVILYDKIPGGIGLSERLYEIHAELMLRGCELVEACACEDGCPSCVGPGGEVGYGGKREALALLKVLADRG
ncbi:MAG: ATP-dependent helicase [Anaerolineales bacterium]|nr:MAG: ATP-dependent helicase [Anaerolineales bacterium]